LSGEEVQTLFEDPSYSIVTLAICTYSGLLKAFQLSCWKFWQWFLNTYFDSSVQLTLLCH